MSNAMKYIITPDHKPLYAMRRCFGPPSGPLSRPTLVTLEVIRDILMQKDAPTLYETLPKNPQMSQYSTPVLLTLENYTKPYDMLIAEKAAKEAAVQQAKRRTIRPTPAPKAETPIKTKQVSKVEEVVAETEIPNLEEIEVKVRTAEEPIVEPASVEVVPLVADVAAASVVEEPVVEASVEVSEEPAAVEEAPVEVPANVSVKSIQRHGKKNRR